MLLVAVVDGGLDHVGRDSFAAVVDQVPTQLLAAGVAFAAVGGLAAVAENVAHAAVGLAEHHEPADRGWALVSFECSLFDDLA